MASILSRPQCVEIPLPSNVLPYECILLTLWVPLDGNPQLITPHPPPPVNHPPVFQFHPAVYLHYHPHVCQPHAVSCGTPPSRVFPAPVVVSSPADAVSLPDGVFHRPIVAATLSPWQGPFRHSFEQPAALHRLLGPS